MVFIGNTIYKIMIYVAPAMCSVSDKKNKLDLIITTDKNGLCQKLAVNTNVTLLDQIFPRGQPNIFQ